MAIAHSKLTAQGQISVPLGIRKKLGLGPGSVLEWDEEDEKIVVRRATRYSSKDIHNVLFPEGPPEKKSLAQLKEAIRQSIRVRHPRPHATRRDASD